MSEKREHVPVLLKEVVAEFRPEPGKKIIDATVGFGGHTEALIKHGAEVLAIDWDPEVLKKTKKRLRRSVGKPCPGASWNLAEGNFRQIKTIAVNNNFCPVNGVLFDLGVSRWHYKQAKRGFSFKDKSLDMRINPQINQTAADIINYYSLQELDELFAKLVQEKLAKPIAEAVVHARRVKKFSSGIQLAELVTEVYKKHHEKTDYHPATKVFLALRIAVNKEFENLKTGLANALEILKPKGKILVISFHSGEDRIAKLFGKKQIKVGGIRTTKLVFPKKKEINQNPLARSAKLRILTK